MSWYVSVHGPLHRHGQALLIGGYSLLVPEKRLGARHLRTNSMLSDADHPISGPLNDPYAC
jgi:hypothetical protein